MRGDFSRIRLSRGKGYTSVLEQQGRVSLDADANEQRFLDERLRRVEIRDVIGELGAPAGDAGFAVTVADGALQIGAGRYYVGGLLVENPAPVPYDSQPFVTSANNSAALLAAVAAGKQAVQFYLRAWQRLVTVLDDPCLREPALGQADTTARVQVAWQVIPQCVAYEPGQPPGACCAGMYTPQQATVSTGTLSAGMGGSGADCGCGPVATAGYQGIENQLYRVEIHAPGDLTQANSATFKWSRENGSVVSAVTSAAQGSNTVTLSSAGPDANLGFQAQQWVELTDDTYDLGDPPGAPGTLYQVQVPDKDALTLQFYAPVSQPVNTALHAKARRWDQSGPGAGPAGIPLASGTAVPMPSGQATGMQFELESGITVTFGPGTYQPGDCWTFPARTATGSVEWPPCGSDGNSFQPPFSPEVCQAPLACMHVAPSSASSGSAPDPGTAGSAGGAREPAASPAVLESLTGAVTSVKVGGIAFGPTGLIGALQAGQSVTTPAPAPPIEDCRVIFGPLARQAIHVTGINWRNDDLMTLDALVANGLTVTLDQPVTGPVSGGSFVVTVEPQSTLVTLEARLTGQDESANVVIAAEPVSAGSLKLQQNRAAVIRTIEVMDMVVRSQGSSLTWSLPLQIAEESIQPLISGGAYFHEWARARVRLAGQALFASGGSGLVYLDGKALGRPGTQLADPDVQRVDLSLPSGSGQVASDFESWFQLAPAQTVASLGLNPPALTVIIGKEGQFAGVAEAGSTDAVIPTAYLSLLYQAIAPVTISLSLAASDGSTTGVGTVASVEASVSVAKGQTSASFPVTVSGSPPPGQTYAFTLTATVATAASNWNPALSTQFTVTAPARGIVLKEPTGPAQPDDLSPVPPAQAAESPPAPQVLAGSREPPTVQIKVPQFPEPDPPQSPPPAPPAADEAPEPPTPAQPPSDPPAPTQ
jgi:Family of unknown function (DUF6519)